MKVILSSIYLITTLLFSISCDNNKNRIEEYHAEEHISKITESDVVGLYICGSLINEGNATIDLYYDGSFLMEDPYLTEADTAVGEWILKGSSIDFYMDGKMIFAAHISRRISTFKEVNEVTDKTKIRGLILKGRMWEKIR